jgi:hypothetical protein
MNFAEDMPSYNKQRKEDNITILATPLSWYMQNAYKGEINATAVQIKQSW